MLSRRAFLGLTLFIAACGGVPRVTPEQAAARCAVLLADTSQPSTVAEAEAARAAGSAWSNEHIRWLYACRAHAIGTQNRAWVAAGQPAEQRAHRAYEARKTARLIARAMMSDRAEVAELEARDRAKYGHPDGLTFDALVAKGRAKGLTGDVVYESIVESAQRTNAEVNEHLGLPERW